MIDWTRREQPEMTGNDRPLTGYDDFGNIIFLPVRPPAPDPLPPPWTLAAPLLPPPPQFDPPLSRLN